MNALEALCNSIIGLLVSWAATFFVLGYSAAGSLGVTLMFFGLSFARSYILRIIFDRINRRSSENTPCNAVADMP